MKELAERLRAAETKASQQEARATQAEARAKEHASRASLSTAAEAKQRAAEQRLAELENRLKALHTVEEELGTMQAQEILLKAHIAELERHSTDDDTTDVTSSAILTAGELEHVKAENTGLKRKLMAAESAVEAAASLRAKVAKLEAQLKAKKYP